MTFLGFFNLI
ncbi:hypothetical protein LINGRAHAP2_LOCUS14322 [Linum grandiflorum]